MAPVSAREPQRRQREALARQRASRARAVRELQRSREAADGPPPDPVGPLLQVEIESLLSRRDLAFDLTPERPTILTGSNGTGKSTVLRMINSVGSGDWLELGSLPFGSLALHFADGS